MLFCPRVLGQDPCFYGSHENSSVMSSPRRVLCLAMNQWDEESSSPSLMKETCDGLSPPFGPALSSLILCSEWKGSSPCLTWSKPSKNAFPRGQQRAMNRTGRVDRDFCGKGHSRFLMKFQLVIHILKQQYHLLDRQTSRRGSASQWEALLTRDCLIGLTSHWPLLSSAHINLMLSHTCLPGTISTRHRNTWSVSLNKEACSCHTV